jgi:hypothetical protein
MAGTQLGDDGLHGDDKLPTEINADGKGFAGRDDVVGSPEDYSVERVEKVYR